MAYPEFDWDKVRSINECVAIDGFARNADGEWPDNTLYIYEVDHGDRVEDLNGNRFRVMGWGSVQGSMVIRDRYRRMYQVDTGVRVRPLPVGLL